MDKRYSETLFNIKQHILNAQQKTILNVNVQLLFLYWEIGSYISKQKEELGWGAKIVKQLAMDLSHEFPNMKGLSIRNLQYMMKFSETYSSKQILESTPSQIQNQMMQSVPAKLKKTDNINMQSVPAQLQNPNYQESISIYDFTNSEISKLTWSHHLILIDKCHTLEERKYYIQRTISEGWSYRVLAHKIDQNLFENQGSLPNNFDETLPYKQSELAKQTLKDHYIFDFLDLADEAKERDIEKALLKEITRFLLELGSGFAFMGQQYHLNIGGKDYYLDLLFYHTLLNSYFIIELKIDDFKPEYAGKLNFYLNVADDLLKKEHQNPTIGLLLCKSANKVIAEYSLKDNNKPVGIATYKLLPKEEKFIDLLEQKLKNE